MIRTHKEISHVVVAICALAFCSIAPGLALAEDIRYDGTFSLAANGDMAVTIKLTPPMAVYQKLRDSISNLYLLMRGFSSNRADVEVIDKKADWDDQNRTITLSMKWLGAALNMGDRWEMEVPKGADFVNLDEAKKTLYFNEMMTVAAGTIIRGTSKLTLPPGARQFKWEDPRRVAVYVMPPPPSSSSGSRILLWVGAALAVVGLGLTAASFIVRPSPPAATPS